jgi:hypothetical protein
MPTTNKKNKELYDDGILKKQTDNNIKYIIITTLQELINFIKKINSFINSEIIKCNINNIICDKLKYISILKMIYEIINDPIKIMSKTKLNIRSDEYTDKGYYYIKNLNISIQYRDTNTNLLEIINQCIENNISISMEIKLNNSASVVKLLFNKLIVEDKPIIKLSNTKNIKETIKEIKKYNIINKIKNIIKIVK